MRKLFIGVGNLHRGDDGVGPFLAQRMAEEGDLALLGVEVTPHSGEGISLMQLWDGAEQVVIVDAMRTGKNLGAIHRFDVLADVLHSGVFRYSSHVFGLAEAVELARKLGKLPKSMIIYGIEGSSWTFGEPFSKVVAKAAERVRDQVLQEFGAVGGKVGGKAAIGVAVKKTAKSKKVAPKKRAATRCVRIVKTKASSV